MHFLKLIRFPNLIIVALTQYLLYGLVFLPYFQAANIMPALDYSHFSLLVLSTICIAAGGYIINDILDYEIDLINKPKRMLIGNSISKKNATWVYGWSIFLGFIVSFYLAIKTNNLPLLFIYPLAVFLLYLYSKYFKKSILFGNIIVALFCAFVAGIVWLAERHTCELLADTQPNQAAYLQFILMIYLAFALLATIYREIIKDLEDQKGDEIGHCRTLPIVFGVSKAKGVALFFGIALLLVLFHLSFILKTNENWYALSFTLLVVILPLIISMFKLIKAMNTKDFHKLSQTAKFIMLAGLVLLFLIA